MSLSVHKALLEWNKKVTSHLYLGSILLINKDVPKFETHFGMLDYDWLLRVTESRKCKSINPCVIRYVQGGNLSLNPDYRRKDFYMIMMQIDGCLSGMKKLCGTRARYHYYMGELKLARYWFLHSNLHWKNVLYYVTSFVPVVRKYVLKKYRVFG